MTQHVLLILLGDTLNRQQVWRALQDTQAHLVFALDEDDGVQRFYEARPDLVLIEGRLLRGLASDHVCLRLRRASRGSRVPIVVYDSGVPPAAALADASVPHAFEGRNLAEALENLLAAGPGGFSRDATRLLDSDSGLPGEVTTVVGYENPFVEPGGVDEWELETPTPVGDLPEGSSRLHDADPSLDRNVADSSGFEERPVVGSERDPRLLEEPVRQDEVGERRARGPGRSLDESQLGIRLTERIRSLHAALDSANHYQLLGLEADADEDRIHAAWFDLSIELHPDRFFLLRSGELKRKIYAIFRRISEAHRVLGDPVRRSHYDEEVRRRSPSVDVEPGGRARKASSSSRLSFETNDPSARLFAQKAQDAFIRGAFQEARFFLCTVLSCEPENAAARRELHRVELLVKAPGRPES